MRSDVAKLDIFHSDKRLGCACRITTFKGIEHATWATTAGLLLLLWSDVDVPPDGVVDHDIGVGDVRNLTT